MKKKTPKMKPLTGTQLQELVDKFGKQIVCFDGNQYKIEIIYGDCIHVKSEQDAIFYIPFEELFKSDTEFRFSKYPNNIFPDPVYINQETYAKYILGKKLSEKREEHYALAKKYKALGELIEKYADSLFHQLTPLKIQYKYPDTEWMDHENPFENINKHIEFREKPDGEVYTFETIKEALGWNVNLKLRNGYGGDCIGKIDSANELGVYIKLNSGGDIAFRTYERLSECFANNGSTLRYRV